MARVIAFSCCHIATPETQEALHGLASYDNIKRLVEIIISNPPDVVVNLGDFEEDYYDAPGFALTIAPDYASLIDITRLVTIRGNHDRQGEPFTVVDDVRYEHGHIGTSKALEGQELVAALRRKFAGQRVVYGHTHVPFEGWGFDVGSVTYSGTYGEIIDGQPLLRQIQ